MAFVRYLKGTAMNEELLFCSPLKTTNRSKDIFGVVDEYFSENNLEWRQLGSVRTDGAPVMADSLHWSRKSVQMSLLLTAFCTGTLWQ